MITDKTIFYISNIRNGNIANPVNCTVQVPTYCLLFSLGKPDKQFNKYNHSSVSSSSVLGEDLSSAFAIMIFFACLIVCISTFGVEAKGPLPEYMLGKFQLESSEGFSDFMYLMGVGWFQRSVSCASC